MKKLHGVHLAHHKNTENSASVPLPLPKLVRIPMSMHIGAPCTPLVKPRDTVLVGQKIGDTDAFMAVPIHSGVSGKVKAVSTYRMSNGRTCPMVEIETDGEQTVSPDVCPPAVTDKESFLKAVRESGLVGMGGASFPTHVKLNPKQTVDTLVINAAECEPYITSDYRQMIEAPDEVLDGVRQVLHWLLCLSSSSSSSSRSTSPRASQWVLLRAKIPTAACGGNREGFLAQRSAGCEARPRAEADAGHRKRALIPLTERKALELDVQEAIFGAAVCKTQGPHQGPKRMQGTARGR